MPFDSAQDRQSAPGDYGQGAVIALINNKGGVAKTTTAVNLAAGLARWGRGRRVLLVDLDSQSSASFALGVARASLAPSIADVVLEQLPAEQAVRPSGVDGLDLITGSFALANADVALVDRAGRERRLQAVLADIRPRYSFVILDCAPSLSLLSVNALVAADAFIVPVTAQYLALEGLTNLMEAVGRVRTNLGTTVRLLGILLTVVDYRARVTHEIVAMLRERYGEQVFQTEIRTNVRLSEAPSFGKTIFDYDARSSGALGYQGLVAEVLLRWRKGFGRLQSMQEAS